MEVEAMRTLLSVILILALTGCGVELLTTTAIQGELQAEQLKAVKGQVGRAAETTGKINLQRAIDTYHAEKGSYHANLQDLVPGYIASLPVHPDGSAYGYDASAGKLLDHAAPAAPSFAASDAQSMAQIQAAITRYGQATGYYPPSLAALVPGYMPHVPKASNGQDFIYYPQNGALLSPAQMAPQMATQQAQPTPSGGRGRAGIGVGGAGPMGEVMTGIAISNQLDSMSNAGSATAGSRARRGIDSATQQQNQQQEKVMDNLGF